MLKVPIILPVPLAPSEISITENQTGIHPDIYGVNIHAVIHKMYIHVVIYKMHEVDSCNTTSFFTKKCNIVSIFSYFKSHFSYVLRYN